MFWHSMAVDVKQNIANCNTCRKGAPEETKETLHIHSIPDKPWKKVGVDIFTHKSINYLVIVVICLTHFRLEIIGGDTSDVTIK